MPTGTKIKEIRQQKGLTQKQLGDMCGMADSAIRRYENGKANPKIETLQKIADALEVNISVLHGFSDYTQTVISNSPALSAYQRLGYLDDKENVMAQDLLQERLIRSLDITEDKQELLYNYNKLNESGKAEAQKRIAELTEIPRYVEESVEYAARTVAKAVKDGHIKVVKKDEE